MKTQNALAGQFLDMGRLRKHKLPWQGQISAQPLGLLNSIGGIKRKTEEDFRAIQDDKFISSSKL